MYINLFRTHNVTVSHIVTIQTSKLVPSHASHFIDMRPSHPVTLLPPPPPPVNFWVRDRSWGQRRPSIIYNGRARLLIQSRMCHQGENIGTLTSSPWPLVSVGRLPIGLSQCGWESEVGGSTLFL